MRGSRRRGAYDTRTHARITQKGTAAVDHAAEFVDRPLRSAGNVRNIGVALSSSGLGVSPR